MRSIRVALLMLVAALAAPGGAWAQEEGGRFHGETARGAHVIELFSGETGEVGSVRLDWTARCKGFRVPFEVRTTIGVLPRTADTREFAGVEAGSEDDVPLRATGVEAHFEVAVTGRRQRVAGRPGSESWSGIVEATVEIRESEGARRVVERCGMRRTRYEARREGLGTGRWTMTSDSGDYIGGGSAYAFDRRNSTMSAWGDREQIDVVLETEGNRWSAVFTAGEGQRLRPGVRYTMTDPETPPVDLARFEVSAPHRGCDETAGEFTITSVRFDRHGRLRAIALSFVQLCDSETAALRGTLSWRAAR